MSAGALCLATVEQHSNRFGCRITMCSICISIDPFQQLCQVGTQRFCWSSLLAKEPRKCMPLQITCKSLVKVPAFDSLRTSGCTVPLGSGGPDLHTCSAGPAHAEHSTENCSLP
jgi:hypothetical protein